jgi:hypothetical protein
MDNYNSYKGLPFYQQSEIIYDFTVEFCDRYIDYKSRTRDRMVQAARSGKQNIAEGYIAAPEGAANSIGKIFLKRDWCIEAGPLYNSINGRHCPFTRSS